MGVLKKFQAAISMEYANVFPYEYSDSTTGHSPTNGMTVPAYKDVSGTTRTTINISNTSSLNLKDAYRNISPYTFLSAVASSDVLENYSVSDYALNVVGTASYSTVKSDTGASKTITVNVSNTTNESITVGCIKFKKNINWQNNNFSDFTCNVLICAYYFDEPKTLQPGESFTTAIKFDFGE